jgi:hypothetical protein
VPVFLCDPGSVLKCTDLIHRKNVAAFVVNSDVVHAGDCMVFGSNPVFVRVNGGVVHGLGFESLTFGGHWWQYGGVDRWS